jgi:hypothetical protein
MEGGVQQAQEDSLGEMVLKIGSDMVAPCGVFENCTP